MPNCKEHEDCDLVCTCPAGYYCREPAHKDIWLHIPCPDMPNDPEEYYNRRAEEMP